MSEFPYKIEQCIWELTLRCNMRCLNCSSAGAVGAEPELTLHECMRVAEQLIEQGCQQVTLIGGEVFLYEGWDRIARQLSDGQVRVNVVTNGLASGRKLIGQLRRARPARIVVAIDGMKASHERIMGAPGSFRRACDFIGIMRNEDLPVGVVTSLRESNAGDLPALYDVLASLGVGVWQIQLAAPPDDATPGRQWMPAVARFIAERNAEGRMSIYATNDIGCQAGLRGISIDSAGNVRGCHALAGERFVEGNLHTQTLAEIWRSPGAFTYTRRFRKRQILGLATDCNMGETCRAGSAGLCLFAAGRPQDNLRSRHNANNVPVRLVARKTTAHRAAERAQTQSQENNA